MKYVLYLYTGTEPPYTSLLDIYRLVLESGNG